MAFVYCRKEKVYKMVFKVSSVNATSESLAVGMTLDDNKAPEGLTAQLGFCTPDLKDKNLSGLKVGDTVSVDFNSSRKQAERASE